MNTEILINSSLVTHEGYRESYEFVLDDTMRVIECVKIDPTAQNVISHIEDAAVTLDGLLFELNHVRVNPRVDNSYIISCLTRALNDIGVKVKNQPQQNAVATVFKPLGEISDNVRFYLNTKTQVVFLSPSTRLKVIKGDQPPARSDRK
ncbi:MAG TPA: hypothetical protein VLG38_03515 [Gammaproteobacteria bacterium]|nr:hypothetical protein [Gammaproteobacteria bacterium]